MSPSLSPSVIMPNHIVATEQLNASTAPFTTTNRGRWCDAFPSVRPLSNAICRYYDWTNNRARYNQPVRIQSNVNSS